MCSLHSYHGDTNLERDLLNLSIEELGALGDKELAALTPRERRDRAPNRGIPALSQQFDLALAQQLFVQVPFLDRPEQLEGS